MKETVPKITTRLRPSFIVPAVFYFHAVIAACVLICPSTTCKCYAQETVLAGDKFQHVTALKDMPAEQMGKVMNIMSEALGVSCNHCHAGYDFAKEDTPHKATAREMIEMTLALNRDRFAGRTVITCMTCHQGQTKVPDATRSASTFSRAQGTNGHDSDALPSETSESALSPELLKTITQQYRQLSGRVPTKQEWKARRLEGERVEPNGKTEPEVVQLSSPSTWEQITDYGQLKVTERFDRGTVVKLAGDKPIELKADEQSQIKLEASLWLGLDLLSQFTHWTTMPGTSIDDRPMYVLRAREGDLTHYFMFDQQSRTLRRRLTSLPTVLGAYVIQVDYEDYQEVNGWPIATTTHFRMPSVRWKRHCRIGF